MKIEKIKQLNIPKNPGSYQFKNIKNEIIYIGKAVNLNSRVLSYWRKSADHTPAKFSMMKKIRSVEWIETDSEIEALLLESNLIKKHQPQYNVTLRDDKRYVYIKVSVDEEWPRIFLVRKFDKSGKFFGPFVSTEAVRETLKVVRKIWPYRSCSRLPKKTCLYYRINKCPGCCEDLVDRKEYKKTIRQIVLFLEGKKKQVVKDIEKEIKMLISPLRGEEHSQGINSRKGCDAKITETDRRLVNLKFQLINLKKILEGSGVLSLIDKYATDVVELAKILSLPKVPNRIEGYDISNILGKHAVGSMVVFNDGEANKSEYRKFKIKIVDDDAGDVWMLHEVLSRRFKRIIDKDPKWLAPDLMIIDGGKQQLNVVVRLLKKFKLDIPVLSISKGQGLRSSVAPDKIFFPGEKVALELPLSSPALHIIKRVRDESHRFAVKYHRELRSRRWLKK
jgi:excinuclease ABC subunit C